MKRADAITAIKDNWRQIMPAITSPAKQKANGETSYICPYCGHGKGGDGLTFDPKSPDRNTLHCFSCGFSGSIIDLYMLHKGINDFNQATDDLAKMLSITIDDGRTQKAAERPQSDFNGKMDKQADGSRKEAQTADYTEYYKQCAARLKDAEAGKAARDYINNRGISTETAIAAGIGFDPAADPANAPGESDGKIYPEPRIIAPCNESFYIARAIDPKAAYKASMPKGSKASIFNKKILYKSDLVFIVEGLFDCLSLIELGQAAIALNAAGYGTKLIDILKAKPANCSFIVVPDNDEGNEGPRLLLENMTEQLKTIGYKTIIYNVAGNYHDINDEFLADKQALIDNINAAIAEATRDDLAEFLEKVQTDIYKPHATGVNFIDTLLNGGVENQTLTLIAAAPAAGKTTLCSQIAESIARNGRPVIYLNFEMAKEQMLSKVISARLLKHKGIRKTAKEIRRGYSWTDADREAITAEVELYRQETRPRYIDATIVQPELNAIINYLETEAKRAIAKGTQAPAVFVDYLHLIGGGSGDSLQENIKAVCMALKTYAIKYNAFVFGILAINRESMKDGKITLYSGRDSSNIEYSADAFISLNYEKIDNGEIKITDLEAMENYRAFNKRWLMILRALKDRGDGQATAQRVIFEPAANTFYGTESNTPYI